MKLLGYNTKGRARHTHLFSSEEKEETELATALSPTEKDRVEMQGLRLP